MIRQHPRLFQLIINILVKYRPFLVKPGRQSDRFLGVSDTLVRGMTPI